MSDLSLSNTSSSPSTSYLPPTLTIAPAQVVRGEGVLERSGEMIARLGQRPLLVGGDRTLAVVRPVLQSALESHVHQLAHVSYAPDCSEASLKALHQAVVQHEADVIVGIGGGKALDAAKLLAYRCGLPIVTLPTSAATCAAWTALSNVYTDQGAFLYDVGLSKCPDLLILDYNLVQTAPQRTLVAGIGDALAKWYEASVSSGHSEQSLIIAAVQQARVLRDLLLQKSMVALQAPGSSVWREVVDATILLAGVIGGLGGAQCRTVAAHAVHNGLTHLLQSHGTLHGEKVAYGILVQLRLEEMIQGSVLAASSRQQLLNFYSEIGLPMSLADLGLADVTLSDLQRSAELACRPNSDIHHLPFEVTPIQLMAAMVSTTAPCAESRSQEPGVMQRGFSETSIQEPESIIPPGFPPFCP